MKCSLEISNFLEGISSLSHSIVSVFFFALITEEGFLYLLAILWNSAFRCLYLSFSPLLFTSLLFTVICTTTILIINLIIQSSQVWSMMETIYHRFLTFRTSSSRGTTLFGPTYYFKGVCVVNNLWKMELLSPWSRRQT